MIDPVIAEDGHTYERENILEYFDEEELEESETVESPVTKKQMGFKLVA